MLLKPAYASLFPIPYKHLGPDKQQAKMRNKCAVACIFLHFGCKERARGKKFGSTPKNRNPNQDRHRLYQIQELEN